MLIASQQMGQLGIVGCGNFLEFLKNHPVASIQQMEIENYGLLQISHILLKI